MAAMSVSTNLTSGTTGEFALTAEQTERLRQLAENRQMSESQVVAKALELYFNLSELFGDELAQGESLSSTMPPEFAIEVAAFERLRPALQDQYGGQAVAIYQGGVVAAGRDKMAVLARVRDEYGPVPCYIEWVEPEAPRRARVTSAWVQQ